VFASDPDTLISRFYELYTFPVDRHVDRDALGELFWPDGRVRSAMTAAGREEVLDLTASEFLDQIASMVAARHEHGVSVIRRELSRRVDRYGTMAQVWSVYSATMNKDDAEIRGRAAFAFNLLQARGRWWITDLLSYTERSHEPIPEKYLSRLGASNT